MTPYTDLLARLEAATEGSRELDALIAAATKTGARRLYELAEGCHYEYEASEDIGKVNVFSIGPTLRHLEQIYDAPHFTESLDAALTLVKGAWWEIGKVQAKDSPMRSFGHGKMFMAQVGNGWGEKPYKGYSDVPALALCIAALRARQSMENRK